MQYNGESMWVTNPIICHYTTRIYTNCHDLVCQEKEKLKWDYFFN